MVVKEQELSSNEWADLPLVQITQTGFQVLKVLKYYDLRINGLHIFYKMQTEFVLNGISKIFISILTIKNSQSYLSKHL